MTHLYFKNMPLTFVEVHNLPDLTGIFHLLKHFSNIYFVFELSLLKENKLI